MSLLPVRLPARTDALYDLASLTKALATAVIALRLAGRGEVDVDGPLDRAAPEIQGYAGRTPSIADLLLHRAGLPAWTALYRRTRDPDAAVEVIAKTTPVARAGERVVYSCLGPILVGVALRRITGRTLRELFADEVLRPLGLADEELCFGPLPVPLRERTAPTEVGRQYEDTIAGDGVAGRDIAPGSPAPLRGEANDGNAAFLGGAAGNAGLFGSARAVFRVASAVAAPGVLLAPREWRRLATPGASSPDDVRTFGFQSGAAPRAPAGPLGPESFGHVGFTGVSAWNSPRLDLVAVLLTNRIHPRWSDAPMQDWRREFHGAVVRAAGRPQS